MQPLINGKAYSYADIIVKILGVNINSVSEINYTTNQEKTNNYGAGDEPVSRGKGVKEYDCTLTISMNDYLALRRAVPSRELVDIPPFDITVTFNNGQEVITDIIQSTEFQDEGTEVSQGDMDTARQFTLRPGKIIYDN